MSTSRPFAYNTGSLIPGTDQVGDIAIGVDSFDYTLQPGGIQWWNGPDEDLGYVIAHTTPSGNQPNPLNIPAYVGFWRSNSKTEESFIDIVNYVANGEETFNSGNDAKTWLNNNGYWTSWDV
jgi:hypothetical protein